MVRVGVYLQDHNHHSGGLNVRKGSHRTANVRKGSTRYLRTQVGDVAVWSLRATHSANGVVLRFGKPIPVAPGVAARIPKKLTRQPDGDRIGVFLTYGEQGPHLDRYISYLKTRDYQRKNWTESVWPTASYAKAESSGLKLLWPWEPNDAADNASFEEYRQLPY